MGDGVEPPVDPDGKTKGEHGLCQRAAVSVVEYTRFAPMGCSTRRSRIRFRRV